ncbi:MAG: PCRF domain-containing protein, partial [Candidatus Eremiobacteraeota bacterium]|nr:PCRF domain-containing protein [Candidatus Eremiobacteraeota bacterium]
MLDELKLQEIVNRYDELTERFCDPELLQDADAYKEVAQERASLEELAGKAREFLNVISEIATNRAELETEKDPSMVALYRDDLKNLERSHEALSEEIRVLMLPKDPFANKNIIMEIRPAAGGDEAGIFAGDLFRMYNRYSDRKGWKLEIMDAHPTELNGFKEVVFEIRGREVFSHLKYESGVHRVQRVPETESSGRIHTSTVTVAVLPEA